MDKFKPIRIFGYALIVLSIICVTVFWYWFVKYDIDIPKTFVGVVAGWYLITGLGVISKTRSGYYLFKVLLYIHLLSFPIGTFISWKTLSYMKKNNIKEYFFHS